MPSTHWTPEQARQMAILGNQARAKLRANAREAAALAAQLAQEPTYVQRIKARVRAQVEMTLARIEEETSRGHKVDGAKLDRLASALERLAELERVLDGRPSPGTRRYKDEDTSSKPALVRDVDPVRPTNTTPSAPVLSSAPSVPLMSASASVPAAPLSEPQPPPLAGTPQSNELPKAVPTSSPIAYDPPPPSTLSEPPEF